LEGLKGVNADEGFLRFLWEQHFPTRQEDLIIPEAEKKLRDSELRKLKRQRQRANPDGWRKEWKEIILPSLKEMRKVEVHERSSRFLSEISILRPRDRKGPGRPRNQVLWNFVWLVRAYFKRLTDQPQWRLIAEILTEWGGYNYGHDSLESNWVRYKVRADFMIPGLRYAAYLKHDVLREIEANMRTPAGKDNKKNLEVVRQNIQAEVARVKAQCEMQLRRLKTNPTTADGEELPEWNPDAWLDSYMWRYRETLQKN